MLLRDGISVAHLLLQALDHLRTKVCWDAVYPLGIEDQCCRRESQGNGPQQVWTGTVKPF